MNNQSQFNSDKRYKLTQEIKVALVEVLNRQPLEYGYCSEYWTGSILANYIEENYCIIVSCRTIERFLKESNYKVKDNKINDDNYKQWIKKIVSTNQFDIWFFGEIFIKKEILMKHLSSGEVLMTRNKGAIVAYNYLTKEKKFEICNTKNVNYLYSLLIKVISETKSDKKKLFLMSNSPIHKKLLKNMLLDKQFSEQAMIKFIYINSKKNNPILDLKSSIDNYKNSVDGIRQNDIILNRNIADIKKTISDYKLLEW